jgi:plastocyanin
MRLLKAALAATLVGVMTWGCSSDSGNSRTIEVDYSSDDFAGAFLAYYPREVTVTPGMTLKFHQTWTGEPHSVTFGTLVDENAAKHRQLLRDIAAGKQNDGPPEDYDFEFWDEKMPTLFSDSDDLGQDAAFPCYLEDEEDLKGDNKACTKAQQEQPEFTGRHAYYSSGFIPFEGELANEFEMKIAEDAKEGTYLYYCNVHGLPMSGEVTVKKDADVESQASMNRRGREESKIIGDPMLRVLKEERAGDSEHPLPLAGSGDDTTANIFGLANEFTPRTIDAEIGGKVTWTLINDHTISFNVPPYTPLFKFEKNKLVFGEALNKPRGGWPGPPDRNFDFSDPNAAPPPPASLDAGEFDGSGGLKSSGTGFFTGDKYSVTFTKAGTYPYACLIHPGMIGKVVVK